MASPPRRIRTPRKARRPANFPRIGRRGAAAVVVALAIPGLVGMLGLTAEVGNWYVVRRQAQTVADMAAYAAAVVGNAATGDTAAKTAAARAAAIGVALANGFDDARSDTVVSVNSPPSTGTKAGNSNAVEVLGSRTSQLIADEGRRQGAHRGGTRELLLHPHDRRPWRRGTAARRRLLPVRPEPGDHRWIRTARSSRIGALHSNGTAADAIRLGKMNSLEIDSLSTPGGCDDGSYSHCSRRTRPLSSRHLLFPQCQPGAREE